MKTLILTEEEARFLEVALSQKKDNVTSWYAHNEINYDQYQYSKDMCMHLIQMIREIKK